MAQQLSDLSELTFEAAFKQLEQVIHELENSNLELDKAIQLFEHGRQLVEHCSNLLAQAELKVKKLSGTELEDFSLE